MAKANKESKVAPDATQAAFGIADSTTQNLMDACRHNMDVALRIASLTIEGVERVRAIQLDAAKRAHARTSDIKQAVERVGSPNDLWTVEQQLLLENVQQAVNYWNELLAAAAATNGEISRILNGEAMQAGAQIARTFDGATKVTPAANPAAPEWATAVSAANSVYRTMWDNASRMLEMMGGTWQRSGGSGVSERR